MADWPKFDFGYLTLFTKDLEKTKSFYEAIGIEFSERGEGAERECFAELGKRVYLTIKVGEPSNCELHFGVISYASAGQKLKALGYNLSPNHRPSNPRGTFTYFDPDGRKVGLDEFG